MLKIMVPFFKLSHAIVIAASSLALPYEAVPLHARPATMDVTMGRGFICSTAEEVQAVATADESEIAAKVRTVNAQFGKNSCTFATAVFREKDGAKISLSNVGGVRIEQVELVGYLVGNDLIEVPKPVEQYFGTVERGAGA